MKRREKSHSFFLYGSGNLTPSLTGDLDFSSYSAKLNTLDLGTLTIAQALGWQISHPSYSFYMVGGLIQAAFSSAYQLSNPPSNLDFSYAYGYYLGKQALEKGLQYGPVVSCTRDDCLREPKRKKFFKLFSFTLRTKIIINLKI